MQFLEDSLKNRRVYLEKNKIEAYRLVQQEERNLPLAIDIYKDNAVVHIFEAMPQEMQQELEKSLHELLGIKDIFYKDRTKEKTLLQAQSDKKKEIIIDEYGAKFHINLSDYLDTGLFLDHRETRQWIRQQSQGKIVLNTFAYTGSFSVHAALGGAEKTYSVDLSRTYCEWIKKNLALNNLPPEKNWVYKMDTLEFFSYAARKKLTFDIIIIDPPTFSKNKGENFSVQKDHPALIEGALKVLRPDGFILFSNNYREFELHEKKLPPCKVSEKNDLIPPDFAHGFAHNCFIIRP